MPCSLVLLLCLLPTQTTSDEQALPGIQLGKTVTTQWRFGVVVSARGGNVTGITATLPVPMDWPEQKVKLLEESVTTKNAKVSFRVIDNAVKQMVVTIPKLTNGEEATIVATYEVAKTWIEPPLNTIEYRLPKNIRKLNSFLGASPYIETGDSTLKKQALALTKPDALPWEQTHLLFLWVRENVKYKFSEQIQAAPVALQTKIGDCEELSSLFIAFCRLHKIPARAVWVPGHTYPEFYLEDATGNGHWFPCQAAGEAPDFGRMPEDRPILQKGDNLKLPEQKQPQRYAQHTLSARNAEAAPQVKFIMEPVKAVVKE
jgi:Transglutaminase-like superfamily